MTLVEYSGRFEFSRLVIDTGRAIGRGWLLVVTGTLVLGVAPMTAALMLGSRWTISSSGIFESGWSSEMRSGVALIAQTGVMALASFVGLRALSSADGRPNLDAPTIAGGLGAAAVLNVLIYWLRLVRPMFPWIATGGAEVVTALASLVGFLLVAIYWSLALPVAIAERKDPFTALGRSVRLLSGLRWRMAAVWVAYLFGLGAVQLAMNAATGAIEAADDIHFGPFRLGTVLDAAQLLPMGLFQLVVASAYLQARRIADGPTVGELQEVFA